MEKVIVDALSKKKPLTDKQEDMIQTLIDQTKKLKARERAQGNGKN